MEFKQGNAEGYTNKVFVTPQQKRKIDQRMNPGVDDSLSETEKVQAMMDAPEYDVVVAEVTGMKVEDLRASSYTLELTTETSTSLKSKSLTQF